jgi:NADH dehydrogenase
MPINLPESKEKRIVIIGAGFAGLTFINKVKKLPYQLVLIDKNNYHQFQPLFYQVAMAGLEPSSISFPIRKAYQGCENVFIRVAEVDSIDTESKKVMTNMGYVNYDILILAHGAQTNFFGNKKLESATYGLKSVSEALTLRNSIFSDLEEALTERNYERRQGLIDIVIVGGGATGVELAGALAEMKSYILPKDYRELDNNEVDIYLIQSGEYLLQGMSKKSSIKARKFLEDMGVHVMTGVRVVDYDGKKIKTNDGRSIRAGKVIWAAGIKGHDSKGIDLESLTRSNRLIVDRYHQVKGYSDIYALGDIAYMEEEKYPHGHPQVAQVAIQQAKNLARNFKNKDKKAFSYKDRGSMATVGRNKAVVDLPSFSFTGFSAWIVWLFVHLFALIGVKNKLFVFINWVWNYFTYDQSLRIILKAKEKKPLEQ